MQLVLQAYFSTDIFNYIDVNAIIADADFCSHSMRSACRVTNKKIAKIFNFIDPKFIESAEIFEVGWVTANNYLKDGSHSLTIH